MTYGTICSSGCCPHPPIPALAPASATDAPISFKKFLRDGPSGHSDASGANSRCSQSSCAAVPANSSNVRQTCCSFPCISPIDGKSSSSSTAPCERGTDQRVSAPQFPALSLPATSTQYQKP